MAVVKHKKKSKSGMMKFDLIALKSFVQTSLTEPKKIWHLGILFLLGEIVLNFIVIWKVKCKYLDKMTIDFIYVTFF